MDDRRFGTTQAPDQSVMDWGDSPSIPTGGLTGCNDQDAGQIHMLYNNAAWPEGIRNPNSHGPGVTSGLTTARAGATGVSKYNMQLLWESGEVTAKPLGTIIVDSCDLSDSKNGQITSERGCFT